MFHYTTLDYFKETLQTIARVKLNRGENENAE